LTRRERTTITVLMEVEPSTPPQPQATSSSATPERKTWVVFPQGQYETQKNMRQLKERKTEPLYCRMKKKYDSEGMRRSVRGVFLMHLHGHPHVLCKQRPGPNGSNEIELFGGTAQPGETDKDALNRKLKKYIYNPTSGAKCEWVIEDLLSVWWRPNYDEVVLPYLPPHVTRPKECIKVYQVTIPERCVFMVDPDEEMVAVPLFDLCRYGTEATYKVILRSVAASISRFALAFYELG